MRGFHFSLRWLFGVVSLLAVGCGLLIYASPFLSKLTFTAAVTALLAGLFSAVYRTGDQRAFWAGFAAFGFAYLWMVCATWQSPDGSTFLRESLVTSDLLARCYDALPSTQGNVLPVLAAPPPAQLTSTYYAVPTGPAAAAIEVDLAAQYPVQYAAPTAPAMALSPVAMPGVDRTDFLTTGHSLFAILFALLGGTMTRRCSSRQRTLSADKQPTGPIA